ncbi:hypothetical protein BV20DRAFT_416683 [Pilatotrama ljubarskyi]|nr:hypothetical protein BV20DRAFT_416683 [Pilatotrama ljubarskyi]
MCWGEGRDEGWKCSTRGGQTKGARCEHPMRCGALSSLQIWTPSSPRRRRPGPRPRATHLDCGWLTRWLDRRLALPGRRAPSAVLSSFCTCPARPRLRVPLAPAAALLPRLFFAQHSGILLAAPSLGGTICLPDDDGTVLEQTARDSPSPRRGSSSSLAALSWMKPMLYSRWHSLVLCTAARKPVLLKGRTLGHPPDNPEFRKAVDCGVLRQRRDVVCERWGSTWAGEETVSEPRVCGFVYDRVRTCSLEQDASALPSRVIRSQTFGRGQRTCFRAWQNPVPGSGFALACVAFKPKAAALKSSRLH